MIYCVENPYFHHILTNSLPHFEIHLVIYWLKIYIYSIPIIFFKYYVFFAFFAKVY
jgi:hypothetical protein